MYLFISLSMFVTFFFFFFQAEDGIRDIGVTGVQTCALPILGSYFRKLRDGKLMNKDVLNKTLEKCLEDSKEWATKSKPRAAEIIALAESTLMPILKEAEKLRSKNNLLLNSCRLSLQHLNKLQLDRKSVV